MSVKKGFLFLVAFAAFGCVPGESQVVGRWKGDVKLTEQERQAPFSNLANGLASSVSLNVKSDHTFEMTALVVPVEGTWAMSGNRVTFTPKEVFGYKDTRKSASNPFTLEIGSDGMSLRPVEEKNADSRLFFRKEPA